MNLFVYHTLILKIGKKLTNKIIKLFRNFFFLWTEFDLMIIVLLEYFENTNTMQGTAAFNLINNYSKDFISTNRDIIK